uniref:Glycoside hydrolase family 31 N-terminal domain-containing protein n=1 Tax=Branchiostoma floridae TaxID=7739 RepID=C3Y1Q9_BRAFL|eukprot:XP_002609789.1 hypothetical protein BRAFLDRAFT_122105 [Branchiostoma floridae]
MADNDDLVRKQRRRRICQAIIVITVLLVVAGVGVVLWYFLRDTEVELRLGDARFLQNARQITFLNQTNNNITLEGRLGLNVSRYLTPTDCRNANDREKLCLRWDGVAVLEILRENLLGPTTGTSVDITTQCYEVTWTPLSEEFIPQDCYSTSAANWYGGSETFYQRWPVNNGSYLMQPYVTWDHRWDPGRYDYEFYPDHWKYGSLQERYWVSSRGVAIKVDDSVPLHVGLNDTVTEPEQLCLMANFSHPYNNPTGAYPVLKYTVCHGGHLRDIHDFMADRYFRKPRGIPDDRDEVMYRAPIYSTGGRYGQWINQSTIMNFAEEIRTWERVLNFPSSDDWSTIELDDMWSEEHGSIDFDRERFPDASGMIGALHSLRFRITAWVVPHLNAWTDAFQEAMKRGYMVMDSTGTIPGLFGWWRGTAGVVDFTNPDAGDWYVRRLDEIRRKYAVDTFKMDGGELSYLPVHYRTYEHLDNPATFTRLYVENMARLGDTVQVRVGYGSQDHPILVRIADKESEWGYGNGLRTLIPCALQFGVNGYIFISPGVVGGLTNDGQMPDKELYIRWLQVSVFFPTLQFAITPWQYDNETITITRQLMELRSTLVLPRLLEAVRQSQTTGAPVLRPLWWIAPEEVYAQISDDEFMLGDTLLVAPVLDQRARSRDIYLPSGRWSDQLRGGNINSDGGQWLENYRVELREVPHFIKTF